MKSQRCLASRLLISLIILIIHSKCTNNQDGNCIQAFTEGDRQEILNLLEKQSQDWSEGNLEKFMEGYWKSDSLQFIGKSGIRFGWQVIMGNYRKNFPDTAAMGKLRFEILKINPINGEAAFLTGKFFLKRSIGDLDGIFTLVFRKIDGKWLCVYDHTS